MAGLSRLSGSSPLYYRAMRGLVGNCGLAAPPGGVTICVSIRLLCILCLNIYSLLASLGEYTIFLLCGVSLLSGFHPGKNVLDDVFEQPGS